MLASASCSLLPLAGGLSGCSGALLARIDPAGSVCLERMAQNGGPLADYLDREGKPDYFEVLGSRVRLLYIERDEVAELSRAATGGLTVRTTSPIRASDHMRFRDDDRARLGQARVNRVPAPPPAAEERPNQVLRARVGERSEPAPDGDAPAEPGTP